MKFSWFCSMLSVALLSVMLYSCDKDNNNTVTPPPPPVVAGKGGNNTLRVVPLHNNVNIDSCWIYIKYNSLDRPESYDDSVYCTLDAEKEYSAYFRNLKKGNYFLYAKGWDIYTSQRVDDYLYHVITDSAVFHTIMMPLRTSSSK